MQQWKNHLNHAIRSAINWLNRRFNGLPLRMKKTYTIVFVALTVMVCTVIAIAPRDLSKLKINEHLITPDIPMMDPKENQKLIPLGKMKGEVDGNFESFYVAIDNEGKLFINRNLNYGKDAYTKDDRWESISQQQLKKYEQQLHFIPLKSKGLKY
jgi:hypothetical protein